MIKPRNTLLLFVSALLALGAAWIANNWALARNASDPDAGKVSVLVADTDIPYGHKVQSVNYRLLKVPKELAPADAVLDGASIEGMVATEAILAGDLLRQQRFSEHLAGSTLAAVIAPDKRAITVRVDDVVGVAGFLLPGNMVDILAAKKVNQKIVTDTILKKIKVLAVDQTKSSDKNEPVIVRAVTLETTPSQAETIVKAREEGSIQLTLRNPLEADLPEPPAPVVKAAPRATSNTAYVTVIRGTESEVKKVTFKKQD